MQLGTARTRFRWRYQTPALCLLLLASLNDSPVRAEEVAIRPTLDPVAPAHLKELRGETVQGASALSSDGLPLTDIQDITRPTADSLSKLVELAAMESPLSITPTYTVGMFRPGMIAQKTPLPPSSPEDDTELDEVVVTTNRRAAPERKETGSNYTIKKEDIAATGAVTVSDVLRKLAPSFSSIDSLGGLNTDQGVFFRGLGSTRFLVLIDGRPTTRPSNGRSADLGRLGVNNIERIEIATGASVLRFGAGAVAGAINIITRIPDGPPQLQINAEGGSFGYSRQTVNYFGNNGLSAGTPGFIGYELSYEHRSVLNNFSGTYYQQPIGNGIRVFNADIPPGATPLFDLANNRYIQQPISFQQTLRSGYAFNDDFGLKITYQPSLEHTLRASFSARSSRIGNQLANANSKTCIVIPANSGIPLEAYGPGDLAALTGPGGLPPQDQVNPAVPDFDRPSRDKYVECGGQGTKFRPGDDQAEDNLSASLTWDWKLSDASKLTFIGTLSSAFENNPNSPALLISSRIIDLQLNYSSEIATNNTFKTGFQYNQLRYNATSLVGSGGNQSLIVDPFSGVGGTFSDRSTVGVANDIGKSTWAIYALDQWRFFDETVILDLGARITTDQFFGTFTTPGAGLRWNFGGPKNQEIFGLRASWLQSFQAPGLSQVFGFSGYGQTGFYARNLALKPENGVSYEIGLDVRLSPSVLFKATYFRTDLNNAILGNVGIKIPPLGGYNLGRGFTFNSYTEEQLKRLAAVSPSVKEIQTLCSLSTEYAVVNGQLFCQGVALTNINAQSYVSTGWEFSLSWQITDQLQLSANHSIIDSRPVGDARADFITDTVSGVDIPLVSNSLQSGALYGYQFVDIPFNTSSISLRYSSHGYRVALNGLFVGLRPRAFGDNYYEPFNRWDITFGIPLSEEATFTGGVFNLFNDRSVLADRALAIGNGLVQAPTTFRLGIELNFQEPRDATP
jgi:iron complex outermembrane recepter protein